MSSGSNEQRALRTEEWEKTFTHLYPLYGRLCSQHLREGTAWTRPRGVWAELVKVLFRVGALPTASSACVPSAAGSALRPFAGASGREEQTGRAQDLACRWGLSSRLRDM